MSLLLKIGEARGWRARVAPWLVAKLAASSELKTFMSDRVVHVFRGALAACWLGLNHGGKWLLTNTTRYTLSLCLRYRVSRSPPHERRRYAASIGVFYLLTYFPLLIYKGAELVPLPPKIPS